MRAPVCFNIANKTSSSRELLHASQALCLTVRQHGGTFLVNDRVDISHLAAANGVHLGQDDLSVSAVRKIAGNECLIGLSRILCSNLRRPSNPTPTTSPSAIFPTSGKQNPDPVIGVDFIRTVRKSTSKPIVAIGGLPGTRARSD